MSGQQIPIDPDLIEIETALGRLTPSPSRLDRDRLMFQSGRSHSRPWAWPTISSVLAVLSLGMGAALLNRPDPKIIETFVYIKEVPQDPPPVVILHQEPASPVVPSAPRSFAMDRRLLRFGPDALTEPSHIVSTEFPALDKTSQDSGSLLRSELAKLLNPGESL